MRNQSRQSRGGGQQRGVALILVLTTIAILTAVGVDFSYLQRLTLGLTYSAFLGRPNLEQHPYADRDYAGFNVKYQF